MNEIEEIKRRLDIVDFISSYLTLKKAGANYRGLCPFHSEKTPSMMVSPEKQIFKCFGCGEGGDIFSFVRKMENLEFREALEMLAARAGVKLQKFRSSPEYQKDKDQKTRLYQINHWSAKLFQEILTHHPSGKGAVDYLKKRGLNDETIKSFMIGYAPSSNVLKSFLIKKGFSEQEIVLAGGADRFYRRIIFPIRDVMGNILGFTGRATADGQEPKYLNTPETIIFHKGRILYNLDQARGEIKLAKATVVVEGQMDVIASHQAGVKNVVATSGTALTEEHLKILYRYTPNIIFAFDSDTAGLATAKKAYEMAIQEGMNVKMVELGEFKDPGEMAATDPALWQKRVVEAKSVIDWYFSLAFGEKSKIQNPNDELTSQEKKEIAKELLPIIKKIPDQIEQAHYVGLLSKRLGIGEQVIFDVLIKTKETKKENAPIKQPTRSLSFEESLIGFLYKNPQKLDQLSREFEPGDFKEEFVAQVYKAMLEWYNKGEKTKIKNYLTEKIGLENCQKIELIVFELEKNYPAEEHEKILSDLISRVKQDQREELKNQFAQKIKQAEEKGDVAKLKDLIKEFQDAISK